MIDSILILELTTAYFTDSITSMILKKLINSEQSKKIVMKVIKRAFMKINYDV